MVVLGKIRDDSCLLNPVISTFTAKSSRLNERSMTQYLKLFLFAALLIPHSSNLFAQHLAWRQYTTVDGLPSNAVYGMLQDSRGFMWFATDLGVCRFNGYAFHRPVDTSSFASNEAFRLAEDAAGRIWFNRLDASVWLVENDTIRRWKYNHIIQKYRREFINLGSLAVDKNGVVWVQLPNLGLLRVLPDGNHKILPSLDRSVNIFTIVGNKAILSYETSSNPNPEDSPLRTREIFRWQEGGLVSLGRFPIDIKQAKKSSTSGVWLLRNGDFIFNLLQTFYLIRDNRLIWQGVKDVVVNDIFEDSDGAILLASRGGKHPGLLRFPSFEHFLRDDFSNILDKYNIVSALRDREGGWWTSSTNAGIFYCKNPEMEFFDTSNGLPFNDVQSITSDGKASVFVSLRPSGVCRIDARNGQINQLPAPYPGLNADQTVLRFDSSNQRLWFNPYLTVFEKGHWKEIVYTNPKTHSDYPIFIKKITPSHVNRLWWASSFSDFFSIDPQRCTAVRYYVDSSKYSRTHAVAQDFEGNIWVATDEHGLRIWRNNRYEAPPFDHPALRYPARLVEILPDSSMVISLRGGGLLFRSTQGHFSHLTVKDGLSTNWLSDLEIMPDGTIYASSNTGLNVLHPKGNGVWHIEQFNTKHGLPSNQVNDLCLLGGELWVATDRGIGRFRKKPLPSAVPTPMLEQFLVNNKITAFSENLQLSHLQNNISLHFFALHYGSGGDINYRYRLAGADSTFVYTHNREINFANLAPGNYRFEVQAQTEEGQWSEAARWSFDILPPWWASWWFRLLGVAALCLAAFLFYRNRLRLIQREAAEREKMRDLETAALRAQMNPHFIFNCLQAIQSFIARNERDVATSYLARFAKLIRLTLHSSVNGRHSLGEEMAMLENYLLLEQMRFKGHFEFVIRTSEGLDPDEISLPPLLVQPYVENALIHGLEGRETGGRVEIIFTQKQDALEVTVMDNGKGFPEKENVVLDKRPHNSVGMMLTQKRLDLLAGAGKNAGEHFSRETLLDASGAVTGTRIRFEVPVLNG